MGKKVSVELVKELMSKVTTKIGLEVEVSILDRVYATGRKVAADFKEHLRVIFDDELPQWNYAFHQEIYLSKKLFNF
jgi:hypothetical protein